MPELPPGLESVFLTGPTQAAHQVRTGEELTASRPHAFVSRQALLDEIQFKGQISDFYVLKDKLKKYPGEQVLFIWDIDETYDNNFLIAVTEKAREDYLEARRAAQAAAVAAEAAAAAATAAAAEAMATADAIKVVSKPWVSLGSEKEVEAATVRSKRPHLKVAMSRVRSEFGLGFKLSDRDAHDGFVECRPFKEPNFELRRSTRSTATQEAGEQANARTQTEWYRPLNKATQAEPQALPAAEMAAALASAAFRPFLAAARTRLESALQQNELVDIYGDELLNLAEDDAALGNKSDNDVKELQSFSRNTFSHERVVTASHWKPGAAGIIGVSLARKAGFEDRVDVAGRVHTGYVLLWAFADPITPQFALEAPQDVLTFAFNPSFPNLVLAGVATGQLCLWDVSDKAVAGAAGSGGGAAEGGRQQQPDAAGGGGEGGEGGEGANGGADQTIHLQPCACSALEFSHHRPITAIAWLPARHEATPGARLKVDEGSSGAWQTWQCATMACDGYVCFWDLRAARRETLSQASKAGEREKRKDPDDKAAWEAHEAAWKRDELLWVPISRLALKKLDASAELPCALLELCGVAHGSKLFTATDQGELAMVELAHVPPAGAPPEQDNADMVGLKTVYNGHVAAAVSLQRSPFFREVYLTVGDWSANVWKEGVAAPLFTSPYTADRLTAGCWSPSRAAVLFLAKADGSVDVWDLADRTHEPSTSFNVVGGAALTSLDMFAQQSTQLLAAGDDQGTLHIMNIPRTLRAAFIAREELRVAYVQRRAEEAEADAQHAGANPEAAAPDAAAIGALGGASDEASEEDEDGFDAQAEEEYRMLEIAFKAELGLLDADDEERQREGSDASPHAQNGDAA